MFLADLRLVTIVVLFFFGNNTYIESPIPWAYILAAMFSMPAALKEGTGRNRTREASHGHSSCEKSLSDRVFGHSRHVRSAPR